MRLGDWGELGCWEYALSASPFPGCTRAGALVLSGLGLSAPDLAGWIHEVIGRAWNLSFFTTICLDPETKAQLGIAVYSTNLTKDSVARLLAKVANLLGW